MIYDTPGVPEGYGGCAVGVSEAAFKCGLVKNPKSPDFYTIARRAGRPDWTTTNSSNKATHTHWCYVSGPRLAAMSVWLDVNPSMLLMPSLTLEEKENYTALVDVRVKKLGPAEFRDKDWLFSLWGGVSSREALIERKKARAAEKRAAEEAAKKKAAEQRATPDPSEETGERASPPRQSRAASEAEEGDDLEYMGDGNPSKRTRNQEGIVRSYLPGWGVLTSDHIVYPARQSTKEVASDLCHDLQLPVDLPIFASASATEACTELLSFLSLATPWAAAVEDKVQDMETRMAEVKEPERRATAAEEELVRVKAQNEVLDGEATVLKEDKSQLENELEKANRRISHRNVQLKRSRKEFRKKQKQLDRTEERCFQFGADYVLEKAHGLNWDYKQLLDDNLEDPIGQPAVEAPHVSSGEDEELSDEDPQA
ncbi:uncharacterized protein LOC141704649 [Apium graveolens]|uniref:uncharacterized protein LOC141704649 n=1 Tax=Apium graveolens TaxID=4045 RepID=UPI003D7916E1